MMNTPKTKKKFAKEGECESCARIAAAKIMPIPGDEKYCWLCGSKTKMEYGGSYPGGSVQDFPRDWQWRGMVCSKCNIDMYKSDRWNGKKQQYVPGGKWSPWERVIPRPDDLPKIEPINLQHRYFEHREGSCRACIHRHHCSAGFEGLGYDGTCDLYKQDENAIKDKKTG
jgi:hypothetical protein